MPKKKSDKDECCVDGCKAREYAAGVCKQHYRQNYTAACSVEQCMKEVFAKGRCKPHYMRGYRKKKGLAAPPEDEPVRGYGQARFDVFTRIPKEDADVLLRAAGRRDGMYEQAAKILIAAARRMRRSETSAA